MKGLNLLGQGQPGGSLDTGDTAFSTTDAACESLVGGGCLAGTPEAACPSESATETQGPDREGSETLVGGGCQVAPASPSLWLLLRVLCVRRVMLALMVVLCVPEVSSTLTFARVARITIATISISPGAPSILRNLDYNVWPTKLIDFASLIELELDFSEEEVEFADRKQFESLLEENFLTPIN